MTTYRVRGEEVPRPVFEIAKARDVTLWGRAVEREIPNSGVRELLDPSRFMRRCSRCRGVWMDPRPRVLLEGVALCARCR